MRATFHAASVLAAFLVSALAGCVEHYEPVLSDRAVMPGYSAAEVHRLAGQTVKVDVLGSPFEVPPDAFSGQVASNMNTSAAAPAHFAAHPAGTAASYRVVWDFAPPPASMAPNEICRLDAAPPRAAGTPIDVYAAFCRGGDALTSVRGRIYFAETQNSSEFLVLIDEMTEQLFPAEYAGLRRSGDTPLGRPMSHPF